MLQANGPRPFGELLRQWRERRRLSQLELSIQAEVSTRHLSFVETGRSAPSREMVLQLTERLEVPLRERNRLLLAAGYAPVYSETPLDDPQMSSIRAAVRQLLAGHEPYPAVVVDRLWNLVDANASLSLFTDLVDPQLLAPPANVIRASLHPRGLAPAIINHGEWRGHLLQRIRRVVEMTGDPEVSALEDEIKGYPCDQPVPDVELPGPGEIMVPLRLRAGETELTFFSTIATFGSPLDVTLSELAIESFFPADATTAQALASAARPHHPNE
ncbi:helix-turn-helix domain-containing protein [Allorhizocola rhizosphaerae]|uniref:helix-turn-helix domain-containing protein n=1 Tax=Allorhizocola rhizosphaerae TaxID=1872709 RepID=UPI000E3E3614|nr:helix-turn-helix transcriptional regulator [Allorhizocola rhizosphaerae]